MTERTPEGLILSCLQEGADEDSRRNLSTLCSILLHYGLPGALVLAEREDVEEALSRLPLDRILRTLKREGLPRADRLTTRLADLARNAAAVGEPPKRDTDKLKELRRKAAEAAGNTIPDGRIRSHPYHEKRALALKALKEAWEEGRWRELRRRTRSLLREVKRAYDTVAGSQEIESYVESYLESLRSLRETPHLHVREIELKFPESKLIVGMGGPHPAENDITLDPVTGLPVIPGTTLKGVARAAGELILEHGRSGDLRKYFGTRDREKAEKVFVQVFGSKPREPGDDAPGPERAGNVTFHDALPDPKWLTEVNSPLQVDILNPHYPEYYEGEDPPHESMPPRPVEFLVVRRSSRWRTLLTSELEESLDVALKLLKYGVKHLGLGARTCAGYGYGEIREA